MDTAAAPARMAAMTSSLYLMRPPAITGVAVDSEPFAQICTQLKAEISGLLELEHPLNGNNVELFDNVGAGYGIPGQEEKEAVELMAREEGIFLDPVYTGKAFSLLLRKLRVINVLTDFRDPGDLP